MNMAKKKKTPLERVITALAATGAVCHFSGNLFIKKTLSKEAIRDLIAKGGLMPNEESACFYESDEAKAGIEFYRKHIYKDVFTFNKYSECLHAIFYENEGSDVYAISCHGFTGDPSQNSIYTKHFYEMGSNVLLPYLRGHGKSEHSHCTMGWMDRLDIIDWISFIINKNPKAKIILHGASMGAATVMNATGENLPENVKCCIEDCGFTSLWDQYTAQIGAATKIPAKVILSLVNPAFKVKLGFDIRDASPLNQVKKSKTPTLFIHGDKDTVVPFSMNYPLYAAAGCEKERLVVEGATHCAAGYLFPEIYWDKITEFTNKYL
ncbi:MAG: alpha/beta hydrolase [Ruminococcaceae bacterium]|nr:alpha/beta hydrolase [Oscillospiraceae bacterium]